jgi:L-proline amide hydrolase
VCRLEPWPDYVGCAFAKLAENPEVDYTMNGPSEFHVVGAITHWKIEHRLGEINVSTLLTSGRHDEATPELVQVVHDGKRGPNGWSSRTAPTWHTPKTKSYLEVVDDFLTRVEASH